MKWSQVLVAWLMSDEPRVGVERVRDWMIQHTWLNIGITAFVLGVVIWLSPSIPPAPTPAPAVVLIDRAAEEATAALQETSTRDASQLLRAHNSWLENGEGLGELGTMMDRRDPLVIALEADQAQIAKVQAINRATQALAERAKIGNPAHTTDWGPPAP